MAASAPGDGALELRSVCKRYGTGQGGQVTAADDVTFTIEAGTFVALTGASGSGKSTLLHMIGAIERPGSGTIISNGTEVTALRGTAQADYRRTVGFVFQRYNLLPALTALDNVLALSCRTAPAGTSASGPEICWQRSAWPGGNAPCPAGCPAASSSASPSPAL
jgi:putative ABC transport system ATP-binding protein